MFVKFDLNHDGVDGEALVNPAHITQVTRGSKVRLAGKDYQGLVVSLTCGRQLVLPATPENMRTIESWTTTALPGRT